MKKEYRRSINFTMEQVFYLDKIATFSDLTFAKVARDMIDSCINDAIAVIEIIQKGRKYIYDFVKNEDYAPVVSCKMDFGHIPNPSKREWDKVLQGNYMVNFDKNKTFYTKDIDSYKIITIKEYFDEEE